MWTSRQNAELLRPAWNAELLRPALEMECGVFQTRVRRGVYSDPRLKSLFSLGTRGPRWKWNAEFFKLAWDAEFTQTRVWSLCFPLGRKVPVLVERDLRVEVRFASNDLSLVIFRQPTELSPKFLKLHSWLGQILNHFGLQLISGFPWLDWQSFEMVWAWFYLDCNLHECTIELLEASKKDHHKCLRNSV